VHHQLPADRNGDGESVRAAEARVGDSRRGALAGQFSRARPEDSRSARRRRHRVNADNGARRSGMAVRRPRERPDDGRIDFMFPGSKSMRRFAGGPASVARSRWVTFNVTRSGRRAGADRSRSAPRLEAGCGAGAARLGRLQHGHGQGVSRVDQGGIRTESSGTRRTLDGRLAGDPRCGSANAHFGAALRRQLQRRPHAGPRDR